MVIDGDTLPVDMEYEHMQKVLYHFLYLFMNI